MTQVSHSTPQHRVVASAKKRIVLIWRPHGVPHPVAWTQVFIKPLELVRLGRVTEPWPATVFPSHFPHQPLAVASVPTVPDRSPHPLKILKHFTIDDMLFVDHDKAFRYAIGLGLFNEGEAGVTGEAGGNN